jgi:hypothetical protein
MKLNESDNRESLTSIDSGNLFMLRDSKSGNEMYTTEKNSRFHSN